MNIAGDGAAQRDVFGAGCDAQEVATGHEGFDNIGETGAAFGVQNAALRIETQKSVELFAQNHARTLIDGGVAIRAARAARNHINDGVAARGVQQFAPLFGARDLTIVEPESGPSRTIRAKINSGI